MTATIELPDQKVQKAYSIPVLELVKIAQQQHGLRHGDHQRYHQYVTRKLRRMRRSLHFQQGTKNKVTPKTLTAELVTDPRFLLVKVFEIERLWAYAMQLKAEANSELRKRFHMISRLRNCSKRANQLTDLIGQLTERLDPPTQLELRAYISWIQGVLAFELQNWTKAKELLETTQRICKGLAKTCHRDVAVTDDTACYSSSTSAYASRIDDIQAQINYCAYNLTTSDETADSTRQLRAVDLQQLDDAQLEQLLSQAKASTSGQTGQGIGSVEWLGLVIPVRLDRVKMALAMLMDSETELEQTEDLQAKLVVYESALKSCSDAISAVRNETSPSNANSSDPSAAEKTARNQSLYAYLQYVKVCKTIGRNLLHIDEANNSSSQAGAAVRDVSGARRGRRELGVSSSISRPQALARLYDTLMQNFQELLHLSGAGQDCPGWRDLVKAKLTAYKSHRCYYLALTYWQDKRLAESLALLDRAKSHAQQAIDCLSIETQVTWTPKEAAAVPGPSPQNLVTTDLTRLLAHIEADALTCKAQILLNLDENGAEPNDQSVGAASRGQPIGPLIDRLDQFVDFDRISASLDADQQQPLVTLPPAFKPVPTKPLFFDLALNHIQFPVLASSVKSGTDSQQQQKTSAPGGGLAGLVKGWFWGSGGDDNSSST